MNLIWINKTAGTTHDKSSGSNLVRHARQVQTLGRRHKKVFDDLQRTRSSDHTTDLKGRGTTFHSGQNPDHGKEIVSQTENGSTFFLITRQTDFNIEPEPAPRPSIDSLCSPTVVLDIDQKTVIRYISNTWLSATHCIQPDRFFGSFSLVWPGDEQYANVFISSALQSSDTRSLYALLAVAARKMRLGNGVMPFKDAAADLFTLRAIQALRTSISSRDPPSDQIVLDLTFLVLAELYAKSPQRVAGLEVYWDMMRDYIISIGGISNMRSVVVCFVMSIDALCALIGIGSPKLDVRQDPRLLGLSPIHSAHPAIDGKQSTPEAYIISALAQLDMRSQIINQTLNILTQLLRAIQDFPVSALTQLRAYIQQYLLLAVSNISNPLCLHMPPRTASLYDVSTCAAADATHAFARLYGNVMWWWHTAVHFLPAKVRPAIQLPPVVELAISQAWRSLDRVQHLLENEAWYKTSDLVLWISAVGCLVVRDRRHWVQYRRLFIYTARVKLIKDEVKLDTILTKFLPLAILDPDFVQTLWRLLREGEDTTPDAA